MDHAPGVSGGERITLPAIAKMSEVEVTVRASRPVAEFALSLGLDVVVDSFAGVRAPLIGWQRLVRRGWQIARFCRSRDIEVVYANSSRSIGYALAARLLGGPPVIVHVHELLERGPFVKAIRLIADRIIVPSEAAAAPFKASSKVRVVVTGIDVERFSPVLDKVKAKQDLGLPSVVVVGSVTRADPSKGMVEFLEMASSVAKRTSEVHFLLAGAGVFPHELEHYRAVEALAGDLLGSRATLTGLVADPVRVYHAMDVMVHLGRAESGPATIIEAMACGLPVVAYDWGGNCENLESDAGDLVKPGDIDAASLAVLHLVQDDARREQMGENARTIAAQRFSFARFAAELESCIVGLIR